MTVHVLTFPACSSGKHDMCPQRIEVPEGKFLCDCEHHTKLLLEEIRKEKESRK